RGRRSRYRRSSRRTPLRTPESLHVPERILVVEDEPEFAALITLWITDGGYDAVTAATGNEALRQFYDHRPDLVVLDLALPGLDGWQVIERIREFSRVPILIV